VGVIVRILVRKTSASFPVPSKSKGDAQRRERYLKAGGKAKNSLKFQIRLD